MNAPASLTEPMVCVDAPARLHLGFLDLHRGGGRCFGSMGLTIDGLGTRVRARRALVDRIAGEEIDRVGALLERLRKQLNLSEGIELTVERAIPAHAGLGSGTQLALAVGIALAQLTGQAVSPATIAHWLDRASRSGIGVGAFAEGGFLVDGGRRDDSRVPPIVSRIAFPEAWRIILLLDGGLRGLHGIAENCAFRDLPAFSLEQSGLLCRLLVTRVLPGLVEANLEEFGPAVSEIQRVVGDHFAPAQGGRFASPRVAGALRWVEAQGVHCVGQSSWGPTGFAIVGSESEAQRLTEGLRTQGEVARGLDIMLAKGRNTGALCSRT